MLSSSYIFYGHFCLITSWNTCKSCCITLTIVDESLMCQFYYRGFHIELNMQLPTVQYSSYYLQNRDEHYTTYYPPRELAGYIPAYLSLLFVFAPILYMGLNMVTCPKVDDIDGIWDTRSNMCVESSACNNDTSREDLLRESTQECGNHNTSNEIDSLPAICDEDVRLVNARIRQQLMKKDCDG